VFGNVTRLVIRSGGQSGVDRAALDVAVANGIPYVGWCPRGGWAEDLTAPPGLLARYPFLTETPSSKPEQRTAWNVRDSHASLAIFQGPDRDRSRGTAFGTLCAELVFMRPCLIVDLSDREPVTSTTAAIETDPRDGLGGSRGVRQAAQWLARVRASVDGEAFVLNIGGPRESESTGIYAASFEFLSTLIQSGHSS
jgi:hypothetical protein